MQTTLRQPAAPVRRRSATTQLRQGYMGALSGARQLLDACLGTQDHALAAKAIALQGAATGHLRDATQIVLAHPTLPTLKDAFDAADEVLKLSVQIARRTRSLQDALLQVRIEIALSGLRAGIAELESGLEAIPLLPAGAPEYPSED